MSTLIYILLLTFFLAPAAILLGMLIAIVKVRSRSMLQFYFASAAANGLIFYSFFSLFALPYNWIYGALSFGFLLKAILHSEADSRRPSLSQYLQHFLLPMLFVVVLVSEYSSTPNVGFNMQSPVPKGVSDTIIFKGGANRFFNHHKSVTRQAWAVDIARRITTDDLKALIQKNLDGNSIYGSPVLSPCAGEIVDVSDGLQDQNYGVINEQKPVGNFVEIDCQGSDQSTYRLRYAHLKNHSLRVGKGDRLMPGQLMAEVGNTGRSFMPHLHIDVIKVSNGEAIPIFFEGQFLRHGDVVLEGH